MSRRTRHATRDTRHARSRIIQFGRSDEARKKSGNQRWRMVEKFTSVLATKLRASVPPTSRMRIISRCIIARARLDSLFARDHLTHDAEKERRVSHDA
jgi:hypothetical protein